MSDQEAMVGFWNITLMSVLNGLTLAVEAMLCVEGPEDVAVVSMEVMRGMTAGYTPEQKRVLSSQLDWLCRLANKS